jgi:mono/diheme cytochrome c family protein
MKRNRIVTLTFAALLIVASTAAFAAEDGAALYKSKCAACHGPDGSGQTTMGKNLKIRDLRSAEVQKQTDIQLTDIIAGGKGKMPAYGKQISTAQIQALIAHIRTLKEK